LGRGASDCKGNIAAALYALKELKEEGIEKDVCLIIVGGEETQEARNFFEKIEGERIIVLDTTPTYISVGARGVGNITLKIKGKGAHSAYGFLGKNPIECASRLVLFIKELEKNLKEKYRSKYDSPPDTPFEKIPLSIEVTIFKGGIASNVIPETCELTLNVRTPPDFEIKNIIDEICKEIENFVKAQGFELINVDKKFKDGWISKDLSFAEKVRDIFKKNGKDVKICVEMGGTDGVFFYEKIPKLCQFGVERAENNIHGVNEFVYKEDVLFVKEVLKEIIKEMVE
jgi:acetylornithine deacetylase/succinyl-diaminopimelate desuccinylase-like protein